MEMKETGSIVASDDVGLAATAPVQVEASDALDRDYVMALFGVMPEAALSELPNWVWLACVAATAVVTMVIAGLH